MTKPRRNRTAYAATRGAAMGLPPEETLAGKAIREYEERVVAEVLAQHDLSQYLVSGK